MESSEACIVILLLIRFPATNEMVVVKRINADAADGESVFLAEEKDIRGAPDGPSFGLDTPWAETPGIVPQAEISVHAVAVLGDDGYRGIVCIMEVAVSLGDIPESGADVEVL